MSSSTKLTLGSHVQYLTKRETELSKELKEIEDEMTRLQIRMDMKPYPSKLKLLLKFDKFCGERNIPPVTYRSGSMTGAHASKWNKNALDACEILKKSKKIYKKNQKLIDLLCDYVDKWVECEYIFRENDDRLISQDEIDQMWSEYTQFDEALISLHGFMSDEGVGYKHHYGFHLIQWIECYKCLPVRYNEESVENMIVGWNRVKRKLFNFKGPSQLRYGGRYMQQESDPNLRLFRNESI